MVTCFVKCNAQSSWGIKLPYKNIVDTPTVTNGTNGAAGNTGAQGVQGNTGTQGQAAICYTRTSGQAPITYTPIVYTSKFLTNNSGIVIDTLTTNGSASGTAIFTHIYSVQISGKYAGSTVSISSQSYTVSGNLKTINVNVAAGVTAVLSLATLGLVGSGVEISLLIIGD